MRTEVESEIITEDLLRIHEIVKDRGNWNQAIVVITGCAGFLGFYFLRYFSRYAEELGIKKIIGLDTFMLGYPDWIVSIEKKYPDILSLQTFDIASDQLDNLADAASARYVIHGASIASPSFYRQYPLETVDANIWGLRALLDFYRNSSELEGFLFFSSSEIYGDPEPGFIPTKEEYRGNVSCHGPRSCYDESKRFGETLAWVYADQFEMPITVARPFNNYGPGMNIFDKRLPADLAKCVLDGGDMIIFSDGTPTRTFCYISDAIAGYLLCLTHGKYDYFNIGMEGPEISVREFAALFQTVGSRVLGYKGSITFRTNVDSGYLIDNPNRRCPSIQKAVKMLGFRPTIGVEEGIERYLVFLKQGLM